MGPIIVCCCRPRRERKTTTYISKKALDKTNMFARKALGVVVVNAAGMLGAPFVWPSSFLKEKRSIEDIGKGLLRTLKEQTRKSDKRNQLKVCHW